MCNKQTGKSVTMIGLPVSADFFESEYYSSSNLSIHMVLTLDNLHNYLLEKGTLDIASIVDGSYSASQSRTRNTTFNVTRRNGKHLFVKQLVAFDSQNTYILQKDATCLWLIKNEKAFAALSRFVPDYFGYDAEHQVLITEFLADARNLEMFLRLEGEDIMQFTGQLASIMASYHFPLSDKLRNLPSMRFFQKQIPWAMNLGVPASGVPPMNSPVVKAVLESPDFCNMLKDAREKYAFTTLIHGDIKWMNVLVHGKKGQEKLSLIDWEIADIGDPMWDIAGVIMSLITLAVADSPYQPKDMSQFPANEPIKALENVWPVFKKFWQQYADKTKAHLGDPNIAIEKALHFAGARLLQTAVEFNMQQSQLTPNATRLMQACIALFSHREYILNALDAQTQIALS